MPRIAIGIVFGMVLVTGVACQIEPASSAAPATQPAAPATQPAAEIPTTGVKTIELPTISTPLPSGPGMVTVYSSCTICHSPRYILMQPNFPKKTWVAEVEKMKKVYGAPIVDEQMEPLVNYLVAIRGNGQ